MITVQPLAAGATPADEQRALAALIGAIGDARFPGMALDALNGPLQAASWSIYRLWRDRAPVLHLSASRDVIDTTRECFDAYRGGLYLRDRSFDRVRGAATDGGVLVLRMRGDDAPNPEHREAIYRRHHLAERLSVATLEDDGSLLAINLYHHEHQGLFSDAEHERLAAIAPLVLATVRRHLCLSEAAAAAAAPADPRAALAAACPALTARELDVCERLQRGWSHDGIAADLALSVATVKTYRARAFERLGLHFRSELFARFGGLRSGGPRSAGPRSGGPDSGSPHLSGR